MVVITGRALLFLRRKTAGEVSRSIYHIVLEFPPFPVGDEVIAVALDIGANAESVRFLLQFEVADSVTRLHDQGRGKLDDFRRRRANRRQGSERVGSRHLFIVDAKRGEG